VNGKAILRCVGLKPVCRGSLSGFASIIFAGLTPEVRDGRRHLQVRYTNQFGKSCLGSISRSAPQGSWRAIKENPAVLAPVAAESGVMSDIIDLLGDAMRTRPRGRGIAPADAKRDAEDSSPYVQRTGRRRTRRPLRTSGLKRRSTTTCAPVLRALAAARRQTPPGGE
jgi:hypothetical protein